jgi:hypothetical protein
LAEQARDAGIDLIRYESVRAPDGFCVAVLNPQPFKAVREPYRNNQQTWTLLIQPPNRIVLQRQLDRESWAFEFPRVGENP